MTLSNIYRYNELCKVGVIIKNKNLIFTIAIPLIEELPYSVYELVPLPISHNQSNIYSYIQPDFTYLLISTNQVYYTQLQNLESCLQIDVKEYICHIKHVSRTVAEPICETILFTSIIKNLPTSCKTQTIQANLEIWHYISNNEWIFITNQILELTLTCSSTHLEDVELKFTGIIRLEPECKGYTQSTILEPTQEITTNRSHKINMYNIAEDSCCFRKQSNLTINPVRLSPVKITNLRTGEFKYLNHKLMQLDKLLQEPAESPIPQHSPWYSNALSAVISILIIVVIINMLRWCGIFQALTKYFCFMKKSETTKDNCCLKIINTNINATPVTRMQLSQILEEQDQSREEERDFNLRSINITGERSRSSTPTQLSDSQGRRRSASCAPSVNMD